MYRVSSLLIFASMSVSFSYLVLKGSVLGSGTAVMVALWYAVLIFRCNICICWSMSFWVWMSCRMGWVLMIFCSGELVCMFEVGLSFFDDCFSIDC